MGKMIPHFLNLSITYAIDHCPGLKSQGSSLKSYGTADLEWTLIIHLQAVNVASNLHRDAVFT